MPAAEDALQHGRRYPAGLCDASFPHASSGELMLLLGQPERLAAAGHAGKQEKPKQPDGKTDTAVDDEQPSPAGQAVAAVELRVGGRLQVPAAHHADVVGDVPHPGALEELL